MKLASITEVAEIGDEVGLSETGRSKRRNQEIIARHGLEVLLTVKGKTPDGQLKVAVPSGLGYQISPHDVRATVPPLRASR